MLPPGATVIPWPVPAAASVATSRIRCQTSVPSGAKRRTRRCPNPPKLSVTPVTYAEPSLATATPSPVSCPPPSQRRCQASDPSGENFSNKTSFPTPTVWPAAWTEPSGPTATPFTRSMENCASPSNVRCQLSDPSGVNLTTNPLSCPNGSKLLVKPARYALPSDATAAPFVTSELTPPHVVSETTLAACAVATVATATSTMTTVRSPRRLFERGVGRFMRVILPLLPVIRSPPKYGGDFAADLA